MSKVSKKLPRGRAGRKAPRAAPELAGDNQRLRQKLETRARIRDAAWELFERDGFEATTTKAVAERAQVAAGTVFVHARDKEDLLFLVMSDMITDSVDKAFVSLPQEAPFVEQVLHLFRGPVSHYARHQRVARAFLRALPGADGPNAQQLNAQTFAFLYRLGGVVRSAGERGELAVDLEPMQAAQAVFALYFASLMGWMNGYCAIEAVLDPLLRSSLTLLVRGLRP